MIQRVKWLLVEVTVLIYSPQTSIQVQLTGEVRNEIP
jgi:hypothetical protein